MKLRNKKTGEIRSIEEIIRDAFLSNQLDLLKNIDVNWEEIEPKEPLIKDEKIRKAVRAWAEANEFGDKMAYTYYANVYQLSCWQASIEFNRHIEGLEDEKEYYFAELCGEEECEN